MVPVPNICISVVHGSGRGTCSSALALAVRQAVAVGSGLLGVSRATVPVQSGATGWRQHGAYPCMWRVCAAWMWLGLVQVRVACVLPARSLGWHAAQVRRLERSWRL